MQGKTKIRKISKKTPILPEFNSQNAIENVIDSILVSDCNGDIRYINSAFENLTGYSRIEVIGKNPRILKRRKIDSNVFKQMREKALNKETWKGEIIDKKKNGEIFVFDLAISPFTDMDQMTVNFIGIGRDITLEHKIRISLQKKSNKLERLIEERTGDIEALSDAESAIMNMMEDLHQAKKSLESVLSKRSELLRRSEEKYKNLVEKATEAIIMVNEKGTISLWNKVAEKIFGYASSEAIKKNIKIIIPKKYKEKYSREIKKNSTTRKSDFIGKTVELIGLKKDGSCFPLEASFSFEKGVGNKFHIMAIARDITSRKMMERQILQSEKLTSIGQLAAGVAHEVNNPLAIMGIDLELMKQHFPKGSPVLKNLQSIKTQQKRIAGIVQGLLELSRPVRSPIKKVEIVKLLQDHTIRIALKRLEKNNIKVNFSTEKCRGFVAASKSQLIQVFLNMINNAEMAMQEKEEKIRKGKLKIENYQKKFKISARRSENNSLLSIEFLDNGSGIEKKNLENIFNAFYTTKGAKGTGLGLSISNEIISNLGGSIKVASRPMEGTCFKIDLPTLI